MEIFHVLVIMTLAKRVKLQSLKSAVSVDQVYNPPPPVNSNPSCLGSMFFFFWNSGKIGHGCTQQFGTQKNLFNSLISKSY